MGWTREASTKRWEENEARLKGMSIDELEDELATIETDTATIDESIEPDRDYSKFDHKSYEQAMLVIEKITLMMNMQDLNRHIRDKREAICS